MTESTHESLGSWKYEGSVSSGTMRNADLIPTFLGILHELDQARYDDITERYHDVIVCQECVKLACPYPNECECAERCDGRYETEAADYCIEALFEALQWAAAPGYTFGSSEGDGACYGFWWGAENMYIKGEVTGDDYELLCDICQEELDVDQEFELMDTRAQHRFYNYRGFEPQCGHCGHEV
jgi:hypothetical protein